MVLTRVGVYVKTLSCIQCEFIIDGGLKDSQSDGRREEEQRSCTILMRGKLWFKGRKEGIITWE